MHQLDKIFQQVNVPCKDNGCEFLVSDKLDAVAHLLADSRYSLKYSGALSRIYSPVDYDGSPIVLISVHVEMSTIRISYEIWDRACGRAPSIIV